MTNARERFSTGHSIVYDEDECEEVGTFYVIEIQEVNDDGAVLQGFRVKDIGGAQYKIEEANEPASSSWADVAMVMNTNHEDVLYEVVRSDDGERFEVAI